MKPCLALSFILASACATPQLAHIVTEMAFNTVAVITHSPVGVHQYTVGAVMPHPVNLVVPGSAIAPITYICLLSLTTVDMTVRGFTVLDGANNPSPCQRSSSPPPAAYAPAREKRETKSFTDWQLQYPCTFGDLSAGRAPACRNPVAGRPPLSERLHRLIVLLPIPPPPPPDSVGDRHHGLVNQPIQCGGNRGVCWTDAQAPCQDRREAAELWNPVAAHLLCLGAVCAVCAPRLHFCTSAFHLLCPSSPSGSYHPRCHLRRYHGESLSKKGTYLMK